MGVVRLPTDAASLPPVPPGGDRGVVRALRHAIRSVETGAPMGGGHAAIPFGVAALDGALGGGLARAAFHEIAAARESATAAATGFALALASRAGGSRAALWIAQDLGPTPSGAPCRPAPPA